MRGVTAGPLGATAGLPSSAANLVGHVGFRARFHLGFGLQREQRLAHVDRITLLHMDFGDRAGVRAGEFDNRLFGFEFDDALVGGDLLALMDQDVDDVGGGDVFAKFGKLKVDVHGSGLISGGARCARPTLRDCLHQAFNLRHQTRAGGGFSGSSPNDWIARGSLSLGN